MSRQLSPTSTLDNLRKEARRWLKALRDHDEPARARLANAHPKAPSEPGLRDVQHALALEHGLPSWKALREALAEVALDRRRHAERVTLFLEYACPDHHLRGGPDHVMASHAAMRLLRRHPEIARGSIHTAAVCGDLDEVERILAKRPEAASEKNAAPGSDRGKAGDSGDMFRGVGAKAWEPLLYLCFTRLPLAAASENAVAIARALLDRGADPNVHFKAGDSRYTPLVGVIGEGEEERAGHPQREPLTRLLLERGAEPYDIQVLYNTHFRGEVLWLMELIHEFSLRAGRQGDWRDPNWSMLDMGGYGCGARYLLNITLRRNDLALAEWLLSRGASPNAPPPRHPAGQGSLYEEAVRLGHTEMADLLVRHGATRTAVALEGAPAFAAACLRLDRERASALLAEHPEYLRAPQAMRLAAEQDRPDVVAFLLDLGMSPEIEDPAEGGQRPLHAAAYGGSARAAALLVERGVEIDPRESNWGATPLGFAVWAQQTRIIDLLGRLSRAVWALTFTGNVERLREVLAAEPELAKAGKDSTLLMRLPDDEARAVEIVELLLAHGADPSVRNEDGLTAADLAEKRGLEAAAGLLRAAR